MLRRVGEKESSAWDPQLAGVAIVEWLVEGSGVSRWRVEAALDRLWAVLDQLPSGPLSPPSSEAAQERGGSPGERAREAVADPTVVPTPEEGLEVSVGDRLVVQGPRRCAACSFGKVLEEGVRTGVLGESERELLGKLCERRHECGGVR